MRRSLPRALFALLAILCAFLTPALAQTSGNTIISNQASAVYTDSAANNYSTVSNTVTVTVANVSGLRILPDNAVNPAVVPGDTNAFFLFTVTNTGNFSDQVRFLASGQSLNLTGPGVITAAVIDMDASNTITAGDVNVFSNGADVLHSLAQNASATIVVRVTINAAASAGDTVQVFLGDAATGAAQGYDNQAPDNPATPSAHEVRTVSATSVNGVREARGDIRVTVQNDAQLRAVLTVPAGPVALGSNINYSMQVCNDGNRTASSMSLGAFSGVYVVMPVPVGTVVSASNTFPAGTLYTTSALSTAPEAAVWTNTAPGTLSTVTRVAFNTGASLAASTCSASFPLVVTITASDATTPIYAVVDAFASNTIGTVLNDQSDSPGAEVTNRGDRNANFDEPRLGLDPVDTGKGVRQPTLLQQVGSVLIGPAGQPAATGPGSSNNTDFTNRSVTTGIAGIPPCAGPVIPACSTNATGFIVFTNTVRNTGNATDTFTLTAPTVPAGFTVGVSTNAAGPFTTISGGGSFALAPLARNTDVNVYVRVDAPTAQQILTGFDSIIQAASANTPASTNRTIDRLYTGFVRLDKTVTVVDASGNPSATIPGATIVYQITYTNIMTAPAAGSNSSALTATSLVITEDGSAGSNNWATYTTQVTTPAPSISTAGGTVTDGAGNPVTSATNVLKGNVPSLAPGETGTFQFRRLIN
ncbi:MAG TPA: hypothetical protein VGX24_04285 [Pyrinomonadaceae bacterium]|jgi:alpha-D-ribose 1-methylphosphonate 5-triphosphate synthase subunit PhnH|nr:hypothetical protein [Pyrinomonadaceae bacterium]